MKVHDPLFIQFDGTPVTGRAPARVRIPSGATLTGFQEGGVRKAYSAFRTSLNLSIAKFSIQERVLIDGTRIRMVSNQDQDVVYVWPPTLAGRRTAVGYSSGHDVGYLPIYDRPVIDHADEIIPLLEYPPEPEYPPPIQYPEGPTFHVGFGEVETHRIISVDGDPVTFTHELRPETERSHVYFLTSDSATSIQHFRTREPPDEQMGTPGHVTEEYLFFASTPYGPFDDPVNAGFPQGLRGGVPASEEYIAEYLAEHPDTPNPERFGRAYLYHAVWTKSPVWVEDEYATGGGYWVNSWTASESYDPWPDTAYRSAYASWASGLASAQAAWQAEVDQLRNPWLAACAAIDVQNAAIDAANNVIRNTVFPGITSIRVASRAAQIAAIKAKIAGGLGVPTLAAKILSFPYNVGYTAVDAPGDAPEFYEFPPEETPVPFSGKWSASPTSSSLFGTHVCDPRCIFGWTASGTASRGVAWSGGPQTGEIKGLDEASFQPRAGYTVFVNKGLKGYDGTDGRMNSDAFVPPETTVTTVFLEYEIFDMFTGEWVWTPSIGLMNEDSVWIKSLGGYKDQAMATATEYSPRAVRVLGAIRQKRLSDWTWSLPATVDAGWGGAITQDISTGGEGGEPPPDMIIVVEGMPDASTPIIDAGTDVGRVVLYEVDQYGVRPSMAWDGSLKSLIVNVMKAVL